MPLAVGLLALLLAASAEPAPRRITIVLPDGWPAEAFERFRGFARREGIELDIAREADRVSSGEVVRLAASPPSASFRRRLAAFPVRLEAGAGGRGAAAGFVFDGRVYRDPGDAIVLNDPGRPAETLVLGNSREAALRTVRWVFRDPSRTIHGGSFRAVSGELSKEGRFRRGGDGRLVIDPTTGTDRIADRERFFSGLATERRGVAVWRFPASERRAFEKWAPVLDRFSSGRRRTPGGSSPARLPVKVYLYPDPSAKALFMGSSRPADVSWDATGGRVDVDASAPIAPDLVSPILAAAAIGGGEPRLRARPMLLLAAGARAHGRWWGRDVASFAALLERAGVGVAVEDVLQAGDRDDVSPICVVGAAAAWLDAGARAADASAVERALALPDRELAATLERWRAAAASVRFSAPRRRALPSGFLRGVSYAMSNSIEGSYASPRSFLTLKRLAAMSVNSISVMPYGFSPTERSSELGFVHRNPRGETDEGIVRAVSDARTVSMSAMSKPQIWVGGGAFVGTVAMGSPEEWDRWFRAYRRFIVHHAIVAEASGAAIFCVGTELSGTETHEKEWREAIRAVRLVTGAPLVYATNWASGAPRVRFWDALDAIGADFYDPLSPNLVASETVLVAGARRAAEPLAHLAASTGKPVIFTEAGYPPSRAAWMAPHDEDSGRPHAPDDAARAIRAVFAALSRERWWRGVYWWKAFSDGQDARERDRGFNFLGRPAGEAIAQGFRALAAAEGRSR